MRILIIGGNRFFGKRLAQNFISKKHDITLLNRGNLDDGLKHLVNRISCDRNDTGKFENLISKYDNWDIIYDHCCYDAKQAKEACKIFDGKVIGKYVFISSQSVYEPGKNLNEKTFNPINHNFELYADPTNNYSEAKRQAETIFFKNAKFPVIAVRFPIVIGEDDYTGRFKYYLDCVNKNMPIYFPNIEANISFISSKDASESLAKLIKVNFEGPLNISSSLPITLKDFIAIIEKKLKKKAVFSKKQNSNNNSPYGIESHWYMNTTVLKKLGIELPQITSRLPRVIKDCMKST